MKKILLIITFVILSFNFNQEETIIIPKEAIRFRVIANSDTTEDQNTKLLVRDKIQQELYNDVVNTSSIEEARKEIKNNINKYSSIIDNTLTENQINETYTINYGQNYFPNKTYKSVSYPAGNYESLVITMGDGLGKNWWCVLFPPLCLLEAEENSETTDVEYHFFIKDLIDKYF